MNRRTAARAALLPGAVAGLLLLSAGCGFVGDPEARPVLQIGEREFTHADFDEFVAVRTALGAVPDAALLSVLLDEFVRERLFLVAADEAGIEVSAMRLAAELSALERLPEAAAAPPEAGVPGDPAAGDAAALRARVRDRLRVRILLETELLADLEPSEDAARLEYESGMPFYSRPETVTLSEVAFEEREAAEAALARLRDGAGADETDETDEEAGSGAAADGEDPTDPFLAIGAFRRGELPDAVGDAVFALEAGSVTEVIETASGFRIYRLEEKHPGGQLEFEEAEEVVRLTVLRREADTRMAQFLAELRDRHPVTIHAARLRFPYVGLLAEP